MIKETEEFPVLLDPLCLNRRLGSDATFEEVATGDPLVGKYLPKASTFEV